ncbi:ComEA family DNA-binding protein [Clavibacter zhangzhiyongii]|uniref:ComEA family DNA-binding protein n=1 Tax=Clavibacter zhangzhiyongii TaxID=2768071 RepID=UPI001FD4B169|nr:ComEA family DNA-binding protein [Clavibacter zhangzhiyongii]
MRPLRRSRPDPVDDERDAAAWSGEGVPEDPDPHPAEDPYAATGPGDRVPDAGADEHAHEAAPGGTVGAVLPGRRARIRLRTGIGAAVVLVAAALTITILVTAIQAAGAGRPAASSTAHAAASSRADAGDAGDDDPGSADATGSGSRSAPAARDGATETADGTGTGGNGSGGGSAAPPIYVHVVGAVVSPGLFPLAPGSRVVDALAAAHGFAEGADPAGVNLARVLSDGEQLVVPRQGEAAPGAGAAGSGATGSAGSAGGAASPAAPVDLNTATAEQLETLPRVGPSLAARIIAWRSAHGRFARVADLGRVPGIGDRTLASLTPLVRV